MTTISYIEVCVCVCLRVCGSIPSAYPSCLKNEWAYITTCHTSKAKSILFLSRWCGCDIKRRTSFFFVPKFECIQPWTTALVTGQYIVHQRAGVAVKYRVQQLQWRCLHCLKMMLSFAKAWIRGFPPPLTPFCFISLSYLPLLLINSHYHKQQYQCMSHAPTRPTVVWTSTCATTNWYK